MLVLRFARRTCCTKIVRHRSHCHDFEQRQSTISKRAIPKINLGYGMFIYIYYSSDIPLQTYYKYHTSYFEYQTSSKHALFLETVRFGANTTRKQTIDAEFNTSTLRVNYDIYMSYIVYVVWVVSKLTI